MRYCWPNIFDGWKRLEILINCICGLLISKGNNRYIMIFVVDFLNHFRCALNVRMAISIQLTFIRRIVVFGKSKLTNPFWLVTNCLKSTRVKVYTCLSTSSRKLNEQTHHITCVEYVCTITRTNYFKQVRLTYIMNYIYYIVYILYSSF